MADRYPPPPDPNRPSYVICLAAVIMVAAAVIGLIAWIVP
jgi:hypothetical protein